ncbi:MAG: hypothetical protein ACK2TU_00505 [Anaerolineales bacterium]|jgi:hypothetical protein
MIQVQNKMTIQWIKLGVVCGILTTLIYPLLILVKMPIIITALLAAAMGLLLSLASIGLYQVLKLHRKTVKLQIAVLFNIIAGVLLNLMFMVQLTVREFMKGYIDQATNEYAQETYEMIWKSVDKVQLGMDLSWDVYLSVGTFLFALSMLTHPRFGKIFGWLGMSFALLLLYFNFISFPVPPGEAGLIDFGPAIGLWYLAVAIRILFSLKWVEESLQKK